MLQEIYLETRAVEVAEGGSAFLGLDTIHVLTDFYEDVINDFIVTKQPRHGFLVNLNQPNSNISLFTISQLSNNEIKVTSMDFYLIFLSI